MPARRIKAAFDRTGERLEVADNDELADYALAPIRRPETNAADKRGYAQDPASRLARMRTRFRGARLRPVPAHQVNAPRSSGGSGAALSRDI